MVFSFFKKDPKEPKKGSGRATPNPAGPRTGGVDLQTRPMPKPIGRPLSGPVNRTLNRPSSPSTSFPMTETALPERDRARSRALETAAKIDAIESEMSRDMLRLAGRATLNPSSPPPAAAKPASAKPASAAPPTVNSKPATTELPESITDLLAGDIDAIEINTSGAASVIDETAILFSNGQFDEAEAVLRAGVRGADLGAAARLAWLMLFELVNQRADKAAFEQLTMDYVLRFEDSPPAWIDYDDAPVIRPPVRAAAATPAASGAPSIRLPEVIDGSIVKQLEQLRNLTAAHAAVQLDLSGARRVEIAGAELLKRVINAFKRSQHELTLLGAAQFADVLAGSIKTGRRDPTDALWMLLLEVQRMLGRQNEFDDTAIQYCVTFEVSPPSWEPAPVNLKVGEASPAPAPAAAAGVGQISPFELRGVIEGEGEPHFGRVLVAARGHPQVVIECSQLRRLAFSAGSAMLGTLRKIQQGGATVELRNVNALVAALLHLLGVNAVVTVQQRRG